MILALQNLCLQLLPLQTSLCLRKACEAIKSTYIMIVRLGYRPLLGHNPAMLDKSQIMPIHQDSHY